MMAALLLFLGACADPSARLKLAAGPQGGTWYPLAGALKNVIERDVAGAWVQVVPGGGVANARAVEIGRADIALANSVSMVDAINGAPPFKSRATRVCNLATLYSQYFQVVTLAGSGIETPADLKGTVLATQPRGNTGEAITLHLLRAYGMTYADLSSLNYGSYNDSVTLMKDGNAQVYTLGTSIPASSVMDLASARRIRVMPIPETGLERMQALNAGYRRIVIPRGTYPGQDEDVATVGYSTHLIARCSLEDGIVAGVLDAVHASLGDLAASARDIRRATLESMGADIGVPMHPRAAAWYQEKRTGPAAAAPPRDGRPRGSR